jgi:hypothetical protein
MKRYLLLVPVILATTAALADTQATAPSNRGDAQAQAAALLSRPHTSAVTNTEARSSSPSAVSTTGDAQAQAAALLSGVRSGTQVRTIARVVEPSGTRPSGDAHAQAAALLSGQRTSTHSQVRAERTHGGERTIGRAF